MRATFLLARSCLLTHITPLPPGRPLTAYAALTALSDAYSLASRTALDLRPSGRRLAPQQICDLLYRTAEAHVRALPMIPNLAASWGHLAQIEFAVKALEAKVLETGDATPPPGLLTCEQYLQHVHDLKRANKLP